MFNRKKKRIAELLRENEQLWQDQKKDLARIRELCEEAKKAPEDLERAKQRIDGLNSVIRELSNQIDIAKKDRDAVKEEGKDTARALSAVRDKLIVENNRLKRDLKNETKQKVKIQRQLDEEKRLHTCPADCSRHANPGPGGSVCRNCTRNPRAVDKYTTETI